MLEVSVFSLAAVVLVCAYIVAKALKPDVVSKYDAYVLMAFSWVEKQVPDDFGADEEDPAYAKMIHKVDLFVKKFTELLKTFTGVDATPAMIEYAKKLAAELAFKDK
jgi:F0F1-type ATP synthase membrane subunit a